MKGKTDEKSLPCGGMTEAATVEAKRRAVMKNMLI